MTTADDVVNNQSKQEKPGICTNSTAFDTRIRVQGLEAFLTQTAQVIFGSDSPLVKEERIAVVQTLSGTGALRVAAEFISMYRPGSLVYISDPSWGNHHTIFKKAGLQVR
jgi:aspartate/tyrosine/aromatic aminotransferase